MILEDNNYYISSARDALDFGERIRKESFIYKYRAALSSRDLSKISLEVAYDLALEYAIKLWREKDAKNRSKT